MKIKRRTIGAITVLTILLLMDSNMSAQAGFFGMFSKTMKWKEEVLLHDGKIIVVERFYNLGDYPTLESTERVALDQTVTFNHPATGKNVVWKTDFRDTQPEPNSLNIILLDIVKGVPYIASYPAGCIAYNKWKRPNPPQILFKYVGDQWQRITLAEFPTELSKANVIVGRPATSLLKSFYTAEQVGEENRDIDTPEYKTILREALSGERCPQYSSGPKAPVQITPGAVPK